MVDVASMENRKHKQDEQKETESNSINKDMHESLEDSIKKECENENRVQSAKSEIIQYPKVKV